MRKKGVKLLSVLYYRIIECNGIIKAADSGILNLVLDDCLKFVPDYFTPVLRAKTTVDLLL